MSFQHVITSVLSNPAYLAIFSEAHVNHFRQIGPHKLLKSVSLPEKLYSSVPVLIHAFSHYRPELLEKFNTLTYFFVANPSFYMYLQRSMACRALELNAGLFLI